MGKLGYSHDIGDKREGFDIKIDSQTADIEITDIHGNMAFPTKKLIEKLYYEIKRMEKNFMCSICEEVEPTCVLITRDTGQVYNVCEECFDFATFIDEAQRGV